MLIQDLNKLNFKSLSLAKSGRTVKLIVDKQPINISIPCMYIPFGLNKIKKQWSNFEEYSVDCYLSNISNYLNESKEFDNKMNELNDAIFNISKENIQLFNVPNSDDLTYSSFYRDNKTFPKLLKLHLPRDTNGNFTTMFFDENSNPIVVNENNIETILSKKTSFKCIMTCSKVWIYQNKIGSIWNIVQLKLISNTGASTSNSNQTTSEESIYTQTLID